MQIPKIKNLVLSLTGQCNFACRYCYAAEHSRERMSGDTAIAAVKLAARSLPEKEAFIIQFSGGEPLLNFPCLQEVVSFVEQEGLNAILQIQTNASLLTDDIAKYLYAHRIGIGVSLDGRPSVNDKLRLTKEGKGASNLILRGIELLKRNNIACGITCVVTAENVASLASIVEMAYFLGNVRRIGFDLLRGQGRGRGLTPPTEEEMRQAMEQVYSCNQSLSKLAGYEIKIAQLERARLLCNASCRQFGHCYAMNGEAAFVEATGKIYACSSLMGDDDFYIGSVQEGLNPALVQRVGEKISRSMSFCKACADFRLCGGGCFARWYGSGELSSYKSECAMKRASISQLKCFT